MNADCILGIDTSNYKTSIAIADNHGNIILDERCLLKVKNGERGLRQSEALFQHVENLPVLFEKLNKEKINILGVAVSNKPRPVEGSYMPCFKAGYGFGKAIAHSLAVPLFEFSHQEGHLEAIKHYTDFCDLNTFLAWHLSGGTCELLKVENDTIHIVGGSKDISFGQVIDRVGVFLGMNFPAGNEMDIRALQGKLNNKNSQNKNRNNRLSKIKSKDLYFNLSGIETQCSRALASDDQCECEQDTLTKELFDKITEVICQVTEEATIKFGIDNVIFAGGVSCSKYISDEIRKTFENKSINAEFGRQDLSGDNAVGIALLGGRMLWQ